MLGFSKFLWVPWPQFVLSESNFVLSLTKLSLRIYVIVSKMANISSWDHLIHSLAPLYNRTTNYQMKFQPCSHFSTNGSKNYSPVLYAAQRYYKYGIILWHSFISILIKKCFDRIWKPILSLLYDRKKKLQFC